MFRFTHRVSSSSNSSNFPKPLAALIRRVSERKVDLKPDDVFKLCVTANGRDGKQLDLLENTSFVTSLRDRAVENISSFSPFQLTQVKDMCTKAGLDFDMTAPSSGESTATTTQQQQQQTQTSSSSSSSSQTVGDKLWDTSTVVPAAAQSSSTSQKGEDGASSSSSASLSTTTNEKDQPYQIDPQTEPRQLQDIMDALFVANRTFDERSTYELRKVQDVCNNTADPNDQTTLINMLPWLPAKPILHIIKILAHINHQDYTLAQRLSRRVCELASTLTTTQCTRVLGQLYRLKVQDSMTIIVRRIENEAKPLNLIELLNIISAAHAQTQVSAALQPLVGRSLFELSGRVGEKHMSIHQLVQCVEVAAKFGQASNPHVRLIVVGAARRASEMTDRLLANTIQNAHAMNMIANSPVHEVFQPLHDRAVALVPNDDGMDVRFIDSLLDVFSLLPFNSAPFMDACLARLADDAGKLHVNNLVSVVELIASYPGAKGSTAVPALALAAFMRKEVFDQQSLIIVVLSLAQLNQFSDDFFGVLEFLCGDERKGFKQGGEVVELLSYVDRLPNDNRFIPLIVRAVVEVIPSMSLQETLEMQKELARLGIDDRGLNRRLISRLESLNVERAEAERAANLASIRRMNKPHSHQQGGGGTNLHSHQAEMEWDAVASGSGGGSNSRQPPASPQQQPKQQQENVDYSGWGEAEVSRKPPNYNQNQQHQRQQQQHQHRPQTQHQQGGRKLSSREMAAMSKKQQQQRSQGAPQQPKKKPFDLKKAHWDMDI